MRCLLVLSLLLMGCSRDAAISADRKTEAKPELVTVSADDPLPSDLRTRKTGSDWPGFLGPTADSVSTEKGIKPWPESGPKILWEKKIGMGYAMPSISRGRLFLFDREENKARLRCWNAETAKELWSFEYPTDYRDKYNYSNGPRCYPVVEGNRVYILGPEGMLHCVRATDGKLAWSVDTTNEFGVVQNFFGVGSTPVIEGDLLLVMVGGSPKGSDRVDFLDLEGNGSGLVAFDKYTGKVQYKVTNELSSYAGPHLATIDKRRWLFLFGRNGLTGLEPKTGKVDFNYPWRANMLESVNASNPVVVGNQVLITECYQLGSSLLEVKPGGYKVVWSDKDKPERAKSLMCHWNTPIVVDGYIYASSGRHSEGAELRCVEWATGKVMWREKNLKRCSLLCIDGHLICLGEYGDLRLLKINPKKYEEISVAVLKSPGKEGMDLLEYPCWAAPIVSHGRMYLRGEDRLVCVELIAEK
jgi:outer membrane protein assembly factor BamB